MSQIAKRILIIDGSEAIHRAARLVLWIRQESGESPLLVELKKPFDSQPLLERAKSLSVLRG